MTGHVLRIVILEGRWIESGGAKFQWAFFHRRKSRASHVRLTPTSWGREGLGAGGGTWVLTASQTFPQVPGGQAMPRCISPHGRLKQHPRMEHLEHLEDHKPRTGQTYPRKATAKCLPQASGCGPTATVCRAACHWAGSLCTPEDLCRPIIVPRVETLGLQTACRAPAQASTAY